MKTPASTTTLRILLPALLVLLPMGLAYGHGTGSEVLPPVAMDGRMVTMEVSSSIDDSVIWVEMRLIEDETGNRIGDVTYSIEAAHGQSTFVIDQIHSDDGGLVMSMESRGIQDIEVRHISEDWFLGLLDSQRTEVAGPSLAEGGLYEFDIVVRSAAGYQPAEPPVFNSAISVPIHYDYVVDDDVWGSQTLIFSTYYDALYDRHYDEAARSVGFSMPFEWDADVISQVETVHVELTVPETFGDLLVSEFAVSVNGIPVPSNLVTVDDYFADTRTVHVVVPRGELVRMHDIWQGDDIMEFEMRPSQEAAYSAVTDNGQYRVLALYSLPAGGRGDITFEITDVFLRNTKVEESYSMSVEYGGAIIHAQSGTSSRDAPSSASFEVPPAATGTLAIRFQDIGGNDLATAEIPAAITVGIPQWLRSTVQWWADGQIDDEAFVGAVGYLIQNGIIQVDAEPGGSGGQIESWVRTTAKWWADGMISDGEFLAGLEYLVESGIIR